MDALFLSQYTPVYPWIGNPAYNFTTDMADEAINYLRELNAFAPDKPFFVYYVPGGTHSPHQPTQEWIDKFHGNSTRAVESSRTDLRQPKTARSSFQPERN